MQTVKTAKAIFTAVVAEKNRGLKVGFVPTMGALHEGHCALLRRARRENDRLVISCYVNAAQFDSCEDAVAYPREFEEDRELAAAEGVDYFFQPADSEIYPPGDATEIIHSSPITRSYEGAIRPNFFDGVTTVVGKLLNLIPAQTVYFGQKDLQQYIVIKRMVRQLHWPHEIIPVAVCRDEQGIAYSSRNKKLTESGWQIAAGVRRVISELKQAAGELSRLQLFKRYVPQLEALGFKLQYLDVVSYPDYVPAWPADREAVLIVAGYAGEVRLKDNLPLHVENIGELE